MTDICHRNLKEFAKGILLQGLYCFHGPFASIIEFLTFGTIRMEAILFSISSFFWEKSRKKFQQTERYSIANFVTANQIQTFRREASAFSIKIHFYFQLPRWWKKWDKPNSILVKSMEIVSKYQDSVIEHWNNFVESEGKLKI